MNRLMICLLLLGVVGCGIKSDVKDEMKKGDTFSQRKDWDNAIASYDKAIRLDPDHAEGHRNRGLIYVKKGDFDKAIVDFNEAIRLAPSVALTYSNRGSVYNTKQKYSKAIRLAPEDAATYTPRHRLSGKGRARQSGC